MGRLLAVVVASVAVGAGWVVLVASVFNAGYWGAPLRWWLAALLWGGLIALMFRRRRVFAVLAGLTGLAASLVGGIAAVFTLILIYGTGD